MKNLEHSGGVSLIVSLLQMQIAEIAAAVARGRQLAADTGLALQ